MEGGVIAVGLVIPADNEFADDAGRSAILLTGDGLGDVICLVGGSRVVLLRASKQQRVIVRRRTMRRRTMGYR